MRRTLLSLLMCFAMVSSLALAQTEDEHASHHPAAGAQAPGAQPTSAPDARSVQQAMKRLQDLMLRIESSSDPAERAGLLHQHMLAMLEQIELARSQATSTKMAMVGAKRAPSPDPCDKKAPDTLQKGDSSKAAGMMGGGMMNMHKRMEQRVDMLEQLLEQVIKHMHQQGQAEH